MISRMTRIMIMSTRRCRQIVPRQSPASLTGPTRVDLLQMATVMVVYLINGCFGGRGDVLEGDSALVRRTTEEHLHESKQNGLFLEEGRCGAEVLHGGPLGLQFGNLLQIALVEGVQQVDEPGGVLLRAQALQNFVRNLKKQRFRRQETLEVC